MVAENKLRNHLVLLPLLIGLLGPMGPIARAEESFDEQLASRARAQRERRAQAARQAVQKLNPNVRQAKKLLPVVDQAAALYVELYEFEVGLLPQMLDTFGEFARENSLGQGFSRDVERRTARLHHELKERKEYWTELLIELEHEVDKMLTSRQRELLASEKPARRVRSRGRGGNNQSDDRLAGARREAAELRSELHPRLGPLGRRLLHPAAGVALAEIAREAPPDNVHRVLYLLEYGTADCPSAQFEQQQAAVQRLRQEINNWNLINGLNLSRGQIERIVALHDEADVTWPPAGRGARRALVALEQEVADVLNPGQRQVLSEYKPCLIPPRNLKDPVRVGQANDSSHHVRWLTRARRASRDRLRKLVDLLLEKEAEHFGEPTRSERQKRVVLLRRTVRKAAAMSDVEFELSKAELAERIAPRDRGAELRSEIEVLSAARGLPGLISQFILKPLFIEQLRTRGQQLAESVAQRPADTCTTPKPAGAVFDTWVRSSQRR